VGAAGGELVEDVSLFDVFRGPSLGQGKRSLAVRIRARAMDRTLSDAELGGLRQKLIDAAEQLGAVLRT
jgi:phenylalanyl-tRNA synthetase beta chain